MVSFIGGLLLLFLVLKAIKAFGRMSPSLVARWARRGGWFLVIASLGYLIFAGRVGLLRAMSLGLWNPFAKSGPDPLGDDFFSTTRSRKARSTIARSAWIEMRLDVDTGAMVGHTIAGPKGGRDITGMSRDECLELYDLCRRQDPDGARLLETYFDRRFAGWRQADQGQGQSGRDGGGPGVWSSGAMTRDEAYEVLGLPKRAGADEIIRAHRSLMKKLHPDHGGSTALAARVNQAKDVLLDRHG